MDIVIDFGPIMDFFSLSPEQMLWRFLVLYGWIPVAIAYLWGAKEVWLKYIRGKWAKKNAKYLLLAIDIPRGNEQTPKAVENLFAYLGGAHGSHSLIDIYWRGHFQLSFSFEIVSIEGYTQFLIHTPANQRNLVESAVYSQYPDAEITEVNDYTEGAPTKFPHEEYDVWGSEFIQKSHWVYPIKTYQDFEHQMGPSENQFKDPMASLMDMCSSLRKGEQFWYQLIVIPIAFDWVKEGDKEIANILGENAASEKNIFDKMGDILIKWIGDFSEFVYQLWGDIPDSAAQEEDNSLRMMNLKPVEKKKIEGITEKVSKLGFEFKIRMVYLAKKEVMNKAKVAGGFVGFMKHFMSLDLNNLKPDLDFTFTSSEYFFKKSRLLQKKNAIINNYIARDDWAGRNPGVLNVEELASLWHFPVESVVKAPLIQKAPGRKSEPPMSLPVGEEIVAEEILEPIFDKEKKRVHNGEAEKELEGELSLRQDDKKENLDKKGAPPGNLPIA